MKNKPTLLIAGMIILFFSSCQENRYAERDNSLSVAISEIENLGEFREIKHEFFGNAILQLELYDGNKSDLQKELFGAQCAKIVLDSSDEMKKITHILIAFVDTGRSKLDEKQKQNAHRNDSIKSERKNPFGFTIEYSRTKITKNFLFATAEL
ncbi:MAG: hypothetical protein ACJAXB_002554 [Candidatus Endobugula sp.]